MLCYAQARNVYAFQEFPFLQYYNISGFTRSVKSVHFHELKSIFNVETVNAQKIL